jgi:hypothetical protein
MSSDIAQIIAIIAGMGNGLGINSNLFLSRFQTQRFVCCREVNHRKKRIDFASFFANPALAHSSQTVTGVKLIISFTLFDVTLFRPQVRGSNVMNGTKMTFSPAFRIRINCPLAHYPPLRFDNAPL